MTRRAVPRRWRARAALTCLAALAAAPALGQTTGLQWSTTLHAESNTYDDAGYFMNVGAAHVADPDFPSGGRVDDADFGANDEFSVFMLYIESQSSQPKVTFGVRSESGVTGWPAGELRIRIAGPAGRAVYRTVAVPAHISPATATDGDHAWVWDGLTIPGHNPGDYLWWHSNSYRVIYTIRPPGLNRVWSALVTVDEAEVDGDNDVLFGFYDSAGDPSPPTDPGVEGALDDRDFGDGQRFSVYMLYMTSAGETDGKIGLRFGVELADAIEWGASHLRVETDDAALVFELGARSVAAAAGEVEWVVSPGLAHAETDAPWTDGGQYRVDYYAPDAVAEYHLEEVWSTTLTAGRVDPSADHDIGFYRCHAGPAAVQGCSTRGGALAEPDFTLAGIELTVSQLAFDSGAGLKLDIEVEWAGILASMLDGAWLMLETDGDELEVPLPRADSSTVGLSEYGDVVLFNWLEGAGAGGFDVGLASPPWTTSAYGVRLLARQPATRLRRAWSTTLTVGQRSASAVRGYEAGAVGVGSLDDDQFEVQGVGYNVVALYYGEDDRPVLVTDVDVDFEHRLWARSVQGHRLAYFSYKNDVEAEPGTGKRVYEAHTLGWQPGARYEVGLDVMDYRATGVRLRAEPRVVEEGDAARMVVSAYPNGWTAADETVALAVGAADDTAVSGKDYLTPRARSVTTRRLGAPGRTEFLLRTVDDDDYQAVEKRITIAAPSTAGLEVTPTDVLLVDPGDAMDYLDARMLTRGDADVGYLLGYSSLDFDADGLFDNGPFGLLSPATFVCCPGGDEAEYRVVQLIRVGLDNLILALSPYDVAQPVAEVEALRLVVDGILFPLQSAVSDAELQFDYPPIPFPDGTHFWYHSVDPHLPGHHRSGPLWAFGEFVRVRIQGPIHPRIVHASVVSAPASTDAAGAAVWGVGERIAVAVDYDRPVTVTGVPHLLLQVGGSVAEAAWQAAESTALTLVFAYTVQASDSDPDGVQIPPDADPDTDGAQQPLVLDAGEKIESVAVRAQRAASRYFAGALRGLDGVPVDGTASPPKPLLTVADATVAEDAGAATLTVRLSYALAERVTVDYATVHGTAGAGDYTAKTGRLTFAPNALSATIDIAITDDSADESDETFAVTLSAPSANAALGSPARATVVIEDDDEPVVSVSAPAAAIGGHLFEHEAAETGGAWTVARGAATDAALAVTVNVAETGGDFVASASEGTRTLTILADETEVQFNPIAADLMDTPEDHGEVTVAVRDGAGYTPAEAPANSATVELRDDDGTVLVATVAPTRRSVVEGSAAALTVGLASNDDKPGTLTAPGDLARVFGGTGIPLTLATTDVTPQEAIADTDYTAVSTTLTAAFNAFTVNAADGASFATDWSIQTATDVPMEDAERFVARVARAAGTPGEVGGTPTAVAGYTTVEGTDLALAEVIIVEGLLLTLAFTDTLAEGDDDAGEGTTTVTATVQPPPATAFTVGVSTDPTAASSDRFEFVGDDRTLSFAANDPMSTGTVTLRAIHNDDDDGDLEVTVTGTPDTAGTAQSVQPATKTLTIVDDDLPKVSVAPPTLAVGGYLFENEATTGGAGAWTVRRAGLTGAELDVTVKVTETPTGTGTGNFVLAADEGERTLSFAANDTFLQFNPVTADMDADDRTTVTVEVVAAADYAADGEAGAASVEMRDDDDLVTVSVAPTELTATEGGKARVRVVLTAAGDSFTHHPGDTSRKSDFERVYGGLSLVEALGYATAEVTGTLAAESGTDYEADTDLLDVDLSDFAHTGDGRAWTLRLPVAIGVADDTDDDAGERFVIRVYRVAATPASFRGAPGTVPGYATVEGTDLALAEVTIGEGPADGTQRLVDTRIDAATGQRRNVAIYAVDAAGDADCRAFDMAEYDAVELPTAACPAVLEGRVEVAREGRFGTVCDDYWTDPDGVVACRALGLAFERSYLRGEGGFDDPPLRDPDDDDDGNDVREKRPIWMDNLGCRGTENVLRECRFVYPSNCRHTEDVAVRCALPGAPGAGGRPGGTGARVPPAPGAPGDAVRGARESPAAAHEVAVRFAAAPAEHDGRTPFPLELAFGGRVAVTDLARLRDALLAAANGTLGDAPGAPRAGRWRVEVTPASAADVTVTAADELKLPDGRTLRGGVAATVRGPLPATAVVDGGQLTLTWPTPRDGFGRPYASDYAVAVDGVPRAVTATALAGRAAVLVLGTPVTAADAVTVDYVASAMHPLADATGTLRSAPWSGVAAANVTGAAPGGRRGGTPLPPPAARVRAPAASGVLEASGAGIADLAALGPLPALTRLDLSGNALADLGALAGIASLRDLDLSDNRIVDVRALAGLHGLERLDLSGNRVADAAPLAGLPNLTVLLLDGNPVADAGPLLHLGTLENLGLAHTRIGDVSALADLWSLRRLDLGGVPVRDLTPLGDVGTLVWLRLPGARLGADAVLGRLTRLRWVWTTAAPAAVPPSRAGGR